MDVISEYPLRRRCYDEFLLSYSPTVSHPCPSFDCGVEMEWDVKRVRDYQHFLPPISPITNRCYAELSLRCSTSLPPQARSDMYKTKLCKYYMSTGSCRYGARCQFAHGVNELRPIKCYVCHKQETHTLVYLVFGLSSRSCSRRNSRSRSRKLTISSPFAEVFVEILIHVTIILIRVMKVVESLRSGNCHLVIVIIDVTRVN